MAIALQPHRSYGAPRRSGYDPMREFNRLYRERRLQAQAQGAAFPTYTQAISQIGVALERARNPDGFVDLPAFFDRIFTRTPT